MEIKHQVEGGKGSFYIEENGNRLGEIVYNMAGPERIIIEHTEVNDSLKGTGSGKKLVYEVVKYARKNKLKVIPLCPFANLIFKKNEDIRDVL